MKNDQDIIKMLESGKKLSLASNERESIKLTLLEHARKYLSHERAPSSNFMWFKQLVPALAAVMLAFLGTAHVSQASLPGDRLYAMKVNVVEEMFSASKFDPSDKAHYEISRMELRLQELKAISDTDTILESEDLRAVIDQIDEHASSVAATLSETDETVISHEEKIDTLTKLNSYAKAQIQIIDENTELSSISDNIHESEDHISDSLEDAIKEFSHDAPMAAHEYLSDQIDEIGAELLATSTESEIRESAEKYVHDVNESLAEGDTTSALISALEAQQTIDANEYFETARTLEE